MSVTAQPITPPYVDSGAIPDEPIYRLSVEQYHAIARAGILDDDAPVELLEGWLVEKMTKHPPHTITTRRVRRALEGAVPAGCYVDSQEPITTADSEPEPDVLVAREEVADDISRHPGPGDVAMVVEVADNTLRRDRGRKKRIYARAGIPVYWIVNLVERRIEVYTDPTGPVEKPDYRQRHVFGLADTIAVVLDGSEVCSLAVRELLP
jgi:Uma2 family endonuclease